MAALTTATLIIVCLHFGLISCDTNPGDVTVLRSLVDQWHNTPPSWAQSDDPCGRPWEGVACNGSRVTSLKLSTMGLQGNLGGDIGGLTELKSLDLSYNRGLTGNISPELGLLTKLNILILAGCGFSGSIPDELGKLSDLTFLALNSNKLTGKIPASLGNLKKLYWFDLADNHLTGPIPVSTASSPGLDMLLHAKHFHFNKNQLSGAIPPSLFSSEMVLIHVLFDGNQLSGTIPSNIGLLKNLEVLRLDRNQLTGKVPSNLNNLTNINELNLGRNKLIGPLPNMTGLKSLQYLDLSDNQFDESDAPIWFTTLNSLTTMVIENGSLQGPLPQELFSFPQLQQVKLKNNRFNGTLNLGNSISQQLELVDLQHNDITAFTLSPSYNNTLILMDNPICSNELSVTNFCRLEQQFKRPYATSLASCGTKTCPEIDQKRSPQSCECSYPYEGTLYFRGPSFRDLSNATVFHALEMDLWTKLELTPGSVSLQDLIFNNDDYLQMHLALFPSSQVSFNRTQVQRIGFELSNQTYKPPSGYGFGPYYFIADPYIFPETNGKSLSLPLILGLSIGGVLLLLVLLGVGFYAVWQKKRAEKAIGLSKPFASWASSGQDSGGAPQLKGARWFAYEELKKSTSNFSSRNEIGAGGYGKVYKGILADGQLVAIKRAKQGSMQGGLEFKTEIELLSRVHHKNLVGLLGFCFEQGEQMLVYEFMPNGSVRDSLMGKSGIHLDWKKRLRVALGSARGLVYLHELANPPIIHRDIKSTNILLDDNLNAKVADFGLSKLVSDGSKGHVSTQVKGTLGYLDPEYYLTQQLSEKSDVYSFGVVMLELLTAKLPIEKGKYVVREIKNGFDKSDPDLCGLRGMLDPAISGSAMGIPGLACYVDLAMRCVEESAAQRPTMGEVVKDIEAMLQLDVGIPTNSTASAASSITDFGAGKNARHPYQNETLTAKKDGASSESGDAFEYSGGYTVSSHVEPK